MRHVKLMPEHHIDATALMRLIETADADTKGRVKGRLSQMIEAPHNNRWRGP